MYKNFAALTPGNNLAIPKTYKEFTKRYVKE